jgi:hypothetical protein
MIPVVDNAGNPEAVIVNNRRLEEGSIERGIYVPSPCFGDRFERLLFLPLFFASTPVN